MQMLACGGVYDNVSIMSRKTIDLLRCNTLEGLSIVYMHNLIPDDEQYCHPRIRNTAYGLVK